MYFALWIWFTNKYRNGGDIEPQNTEWNREERQEERQIGKDTTGEIGHEILILLAIGNQGLN